LTNGILDKNSVIGSGGAVNAGGSANVVMDTVTISNSVSGMSGGCGYFNSGGTGVFKNCNITGNYAVQGGAFSVVAQSTLTVCNSLVCSNTASDKGGAFFCQDSTTITLKDDTFTSNKSPAGQFYCSSLVAGTYCTVAGNSPFPKLSKTRDFKRFKSRCRHWNCSWCVSWCCCHLCNCCSRCYLAP